MLSKRTFLSVPGWLDALQPLLDAGASVAQTCEGSPPLNMAVCMGSHPKFERFALAASSTLLDAGAVPLERDDWGRTALHWAAFLGLQDVTQLLLTAGDEFVRRERERASTDANADEGAEDIPPLAEFQDKTGNTALHLAARYRQPGTAALLLRDAARGGEEGLLGALRARNKAGQTALHAAAVGGCAACVRAVLAAAPAGAPDELRAGGQARPDPGPARDAARPRAGRGFAQGKAEAEEAAAEASPPSLVDPSATTAQTLIVAPPECWAHHSAPWPRSRAAPEPPPENVGRLAALADPLLGALRGREAGAVAWDERPRRVALGDLLRVHDWSYVRRIQRVCEDLPLAGAVPVSELKRYPDDAAAEGAVRASDLGYLDGDTAVSHGTWRAALAAAGAAVAAVDAVMDPATPVRNAFCAVRPPGHHAGPGGAVASARDPNATNGFCIFNNVAVAAAYAHCVYRDRGVRRVALLDFDVHHGNGTEACVVRAAPSLLRVPFQTPFSEGVQSFPGLLALAGRGRQGQHLLRQRAGLWAQGGRAGHLRLPGVGRDGRQPRRARGQPGRGPRRRVRAGV
ncbi:hypothetical protein QBZ16_002435 [Prototheca wickerhamii]|uniref:Histone deacetylase domain-containing protein n=1 Tax=Prototheca wickerhamii TaxID=3111 RepID=A0AAD9MIE3_PROWI|nr:hypothetical protein QBZ16_002435 [Prototheca wickerhamii]